MRLLVTAGPTREYLDPVRFLTNGSTGRMGCAIASAGLRAGHEVTLLAGPVASEWPGGADIARFESVAELVERLGERFPSCDALVMAAAVGDFRPERCLPAKIPRTGGPVTVRLFPTEDVVAAVAGRKRPGQVVAVFAMETGSREQAEAKARRELAGKNADLTVVNGPAAVGAEASEACILSADRRLLDWACRPKDELAGLLVEILEGLVAAGPTSVC
jgi:phosphopantothenoylcysteine decarboxylase/phosphopantothenate--cysteine ligase